MMVNSRENGIRKALPERVYLLPTHFQTLVWPIPREPDFVDCFSCMGARLRRERRKRRIIALPLTKQNAENKLSFPLSHIFGIKARIG